MFIKLLTSTVPVPTVLINLLDPEPDPDPNPDQERKFRIRIQQKRLGSSRIRIRNTALDKAKHFIKYRQGPKFKGTVSRGIVKERHRKEKLTVKSTDMQH